MVKFTVGLWKIILGCLTGLKEAEFQTIEIDKVLKMVSDRLTKSIVNEYYQMV